MFESLVQMWNSKCMLSRKRTQRHLTQKPQCVSIWTGTWMRGVLHWGGCGKCVPPSHALSLAWSYSWLGSVISKARIFLRLLFKGPPGFGDRVSRQSQDQTKRAPVPFKLNSLDNFSIEKVYDFKSQTSQLMRYFSGLFLIVSGSIVENRWLQSGGTYESYGFYSFS